MRVARVALLFAQLLVVHAIAAQNVTAAAQSTPIQVAPIQSGPTRALGLQSGPTQAVPTLATGSGVRLDSGRFTVVAEKRDVRMANAMLHYAVSRDTFPGLPKPRAKVLIAIAPSAEMFRAWVGPGAPEWGAAIAIPDEHRIVMQGSFGNSDAGDPEIVLRHELAHLALHEHLGNAPPRWFDEGYASVAAGEWSRTTALETSVSMAWRSLPAGDALNAGFYGGASRAEYTYALSHLAVAEMQAIDRERGLALFFAEWKRTGSYDRALRQAYGLTSESFDAYWRQRVRRQYGALAFIANISLAFSFIALALGPLYWSKRRRNDKRLAIMRANEAAQEVAERRSALQAEVALRDGTVGDGNGEDVRGGEAADGDDTGSDYTGGDNTGGSARPVSSGSLDTRGGQA
ncbi:MAG: hypothetical protein ABJB74_07430 [Gemmatimonas sp.]